MNESLFSQSWYRVAPLKPRLRSHVQIHRHNYRGDDWYVIQDRFTGRHHRFSPEAYQLIGLMNGWRTLGQIWETACTRLGDHMPTQDEVIQLLSQLFRSDLLQTNAMPNFDDLQQRQRISQKSRLLATLRSPMSIRFPLIDPDRFLTATIPFVRPFLSSATALIWLVVVCAAVVLAFVHWSDLVMNFSDQLLSMENLLLVSLIYPLLKLLHEFGHAYFVKKWGGEVHEMGIMLLVFMPIPYVDATSAISFQNKKSRMLVGAAGILVEIFIAALALITWLNVEPGPISAVAYNIMLIAGISTLLFNGNPLLRFDAYYVLSDFLEIPNLSQRSNQYIGYLCQRYLLAVEDVESPASAAGEPVWLFVYGIASFLYRIFISARIILFVAGKFFFIGVFLAVWAGFGLLITPMFRIINFLFKDARMKRRRIRLLLVIVLPLVLLISALSLYPVPLYTGCEGVTLAPEESHVYAGVDGFIKTILINDGEQVAKDTVLLQLINPHLEAQIRIYQAQLEEYRSRYKQILHKDRTESDLLKEELARIKAALARALEQQQALSLKSSTAGVLVLPQAENLPGRFVRRGTSLGYIIDQQKIRVRVLVPQAEVERVRSDTSKVEVRLAEQIPKVLRANIIREIPAASRVLPSLALSLEGGGRFAIDPREPDKQLVLEHLFQFEIELAAGMTDKIQERVYVRFEHSPEPIVWRWYRDIRRLFLSRFAI